MCLHPIRHPPLAWRSTAVLAPWATASPPEIPRSAGASHSRSQQEPQEERGQHLPQTTSSSRAGLEGPPINNGIKKLSWKGGAPLWSYFPFCPDRQTAQHCTEDLPRGHSACFPHRPALWGWFCFSVPVCLPGPRVSPGTLPRPQRSEVASTLVCFRPHGVKPHPPTRLASPWASCSGAAGPGGAAPGKKRGEGDRSERCLHSLLVRGVGG